VNNSAFKRALKTAKLDNDVTLDGRVYHTMRSRDREISTTHGFRDFMTSGSPLNGAMYSFEYRILKGDYGFLFVFISNLSATQGARDKYIYCQRTHVYSLLLIILAVWAWLFIDSGSAAMTFLGHALWPWGICERKPLVEVGRRWESGSVEGLE